MELLKPSYFTNQAHEAICGLLFAYRREFGSRPPKAVLAEEIKSRWPEDGKRQILYVGELEACCSLPVFQAREYLEKRLLAFAQEQAIKEAVSRFVDLLEQGKMDDPGGYWIEHGQKVKQLGAGAVAARLCSLEEFFGMNDTGYDWLIQGRLPKGFLMLLAGPSKGGKTVLILNIIARMLLDQFALGQTAYPAPVLYLDYENPLSYFRAKLEQAAQPYSVSRLTPYLHVSNRQVTEEAVKLPPFVTTDYVRGLIDHYKPGLVCIDTLRRAFGRKPGLPEHWENKQDVLDQLLTPFAELAHESKVSILFLHHHTHGGRASGSTEFLAIPDMLLDFERLLNHEGKPTRDVRLTVRGRLDVAIEPLYLSYEDGSYTYLGEGETYKLFKQEESAAVQRQVMQTMIAVLEGKPCPKGELIPKVQERYQKDHGCTISAKAADLAYKKLKDERIILYDERDYVNKLAGNYRQKLSLSHSA
jgi:hypothetical protein